MYCKVTIILLSKLLVINAKNACDNWWANTRHMSAGYKPGPKSIGSCEKKCGLFFGSFGVQWRSDGYCYCIWGKLVEIEPSPTHSFRLDCGISFMDTEVTIGGESAIRFSYAMKSEPAETSMEVFAIDGLDNATRSDRFLIRDPKDRGFDSKLDLYRSNLTKRYIGFHHNNIPGSPSFAETYILRYKMGDMDLENKTLWCTIITANHQLLKFSFTPIVVNATIKNSNMMIDITQNLNGNVFTISYSMWIYKETTADIRDVSIYLNPVENLEFQNFTILGEGSLEFTEVKIEQEFQLFKLKRFSIEALLDFNVTYKLKGGKIHVGNQILPVIHEFRYTNFTDGIPLAQLNNLTIEEIFTTKMHNPASVVYPSSSVHYNDRTVVEWKSGQLALCVAKKHKHGTCLVYNIDTSEVRLLPRGLSKVIGYNKQADLICFHDIYLNIVSHSTLDGTFLSNDQKCHMTNTFFKRGTVLSESDSFEDSSSKCQVRVDGLVDIATNGYRVLF